MEIARWDELQLVQRCKEGSEAAFAELVRRHRPRLYTLAFRLTGDRDTAEDVVQETFVAAFRGIAKFEPRPSVAAWLNTIAVHAAGKVAAKASARPNASLDTLVDDEEANRFAAAIASDADDPHRAAEAAELRREVAAAIAGLPFKYRAAVVTRYVLGLDYAEAAASLEMGLNTYKSHLLRGTRMLRESLADAIAADRRTPADHRATAPLETLTPAQSREPPAELPLPATTVPAARPGPAPAPAAFAEPRRSRFRDGVPSENAAST